MSSIFNSVCSLGLTLLATTAFAQTTSNAAATYRFLTSERERDGILYRAGTGDLRGVLLPLSFVDSAAYWGEYACRNSAALCGVVDRYDAGAYTVRPDKSAAGDLQTERVNIHDGANIYDAATWQIAVMLGAVRNRYSAPGGDAYALVNDQNRLLQLGYSGDARLPVPHQNRAVTNGDVFVYNGTRISDPSRAFVFRTLPRTWMSIDPLVDSRFFDWIVAKDLPASNPQYQRGKISWTDWKPITGENAWAFLIGPLQSARLHFIDDKNQRFVPFRELAVQNALAVLPTFAAMQSAIGAVYYAPAGTVMNQGDQLVNRYEVAVENNFSLYAGLQILRAVLQEQKNFETTLTAADKTVIDKSLRLIAAMIDGGTIDQHKTAGLLAFFKNHAWHFSSNGEGEFVQGGFANDPANKDVWIAHTQPRAVDANTWGIAALGAKRIDEWFGFGAAFANWQRVKNWGGYGAGQTLWGVGFSDIDDNGIDAQGNYRQGVMSSEWTAGAIVAVREMIGFYKSIPVSSPDHAKATVMVESLQRDEQSMLAGIERLRVENYGNANFPDAPANFERLGLQVQGAYLYASKRYLIPFGWYANPLPSVCSAAWAIMLRNSFNPLALN